MPKHENQRAGITVAQLIERLKELPQDALVVTYYGRRVAVLTTDAGFLLDDGTDTPDPARFRKTEADVEAVRGTVGHGRVFAYDGTMRPYVMVRLR